LRLKLIAVSSTLLIELRTIIVICLAKLKAGDTYSNGTKVVDIGARMQDRQTRTWGRRLGFRIREWSNVESDSWGRERPKIRLYREFDTEQGRHYVIWLEDMHAESPGAGRRCCQ